MCDSHSNLTNLATSASTLHAIPNKLKGSKRYKLWELPDMFHCSILGTCLTMQELRQIARKANISVTDMGDYDLHGMFVRNLSNNSAASKMVNKYLDKKYRRQLSQYAKAKDEAAYLQLWKQALHSGEVAGAYWALATHPDTCSADLLNHVYGEIHMLSHIQGGSVRVDMQAFHQLRQRNHELEEQLLQKTENTHKRISSKNQETQQLQTEILQLKQENRALPDLQKELDDIRANPLNTQLQVKLDKLEASYQHVLGRLEKTQKEVERQQEQIADITDRNHTLERGKQDLEIAAANTAQDSGTDTVADNCQGCLHENTDLCGQCVLYVGGRNGQHSHFRDLVRQCNGQFMYHDGGREDAFQQLASSVSKADVVLCPLDCISHNAMNIVRQHCNNHDKKIIFIPHASLSSFTKGLDEVMGETQP